MTDRYMKFAMLVSEMSTMISMLRSLNLLLGAAAGRIVEMSPTRDELKWIKQTQGLHADRILAEIEIMEQEFKSKSDHG